jgi:hypothetical protein
MVEQSRSECFSVLCWRVSTWSLVEDMATYANPCLSIRRRRGVYIDIYIDLICCSRSDHKSTRAAGPEAGRWKRVQVQLLKSFQDRLGFARIQPPLQSRYWVSFCSSADRRTMSADFLAHAIPWSIYLVSEQLTR